MSSAAANFEKYLNREPLTEELAALRQGGSQGDPGSSGEPVMHPSLTALLEALGPRQSVSGDEDRPLSREERLALREAWAGGGVTTLTKLLKKSLHAKIRLAILNSEHDPLGRSAEIAQDWAYISVFRRVIAEVDVMVRAEIEEMTKERGQ